MYFRRCLLILNVFVVFTFNITEFECRRLTHREFNETLEDASGMFTDFPLGLSEVLENASGVFGKVLGQIINKKKFLGIESFYQ